ncbi:MAG: glycine zipper 2TM domain-containing protein [Limimaricola sp.]|uniref:glycine zipper 2TM domain-containing protein n=1 Tax=Limimaricola sp. TaxID=2211665 RepID=UPI001D732AC8|nr:glycine zipper 2TM domain-containing protein [Limimaricola sp.]MBI1416911.1 glycine zipper 2TM domain-containing protein [Limimaricola sp.]
MDKFALIIPLALVGLAGCDQPMGPGYTQASQVSQQQTAQYGTVTQVRTVQVQSGAGNQVAGAVVGGIAGAVVGNQFGNGTGKDLMTGAGAVGGAVLGAQVAGAPTLRTSQEWTVRTDNGQTIKVIQDNGGFRIGQRVQVVQTTNGTYLAA